MRIIICGTPQSMTLCYFSSTLALGRVASCLVVAPTRGARAEIHGFTLLPLPILRHFAAFKAYAIAAFYAIFDIAAFYAIKKSRPVSMCAHVPCEESTVKIAAVWCVSVLRCCSGYLINNFPGRHPFTLYTALYIRNLPGAREREA